MKQIVGQLREAARCERPGCIPVARPRGAKAEGLRFERAFAKELGQEALRGQWFRFEDASNKARFCQTDILVEGAKRILIAECKLKWVPEGEASLRQLYIPIVTRAFGKLAFGLTVVRYVSKEIPQEVRVCGDLDTAVACALRGFETVLHWIPRTPVRRTLRRAA